MAIIELYSKRRKQLAGETSDVCIYDDIPESLRNQLYQIIESSFEPESKRDIYGFKDSVEKYREFIKKALCREYGVFQLRGDFDSKHDVLYFLLKSEDVYKVLDVIELSFRVLDRLFADEYQLRDEINSSIEELNYRFREHSIGYQFESGEIIRVDSQLVHSEVVKPTLRLLQDSLYKGANQEFLKAHEHYRHGNYKETLNESLKAFESVMKIICTTRNWSFNQNDTAKRLLEICFQNNLIPSFLQNQFSALRSVLESGLPTVRNKLGGHGQGIQQIFVSGEMARYALNLSATNILFLVESEKKLT